MAMSAQAMPEACQRETQHVRFLSNDEFCSGESGMQFLRSNARFSGLHAHQRDEYLRIFVVSLVF